MALSEADLVWLYESRLKPRELLALRRGKGPVGAVPSAGAVGRHNSEMVSSVCS